MDTSLCHLRVSGGMIAPSVLQRKPGIEGTQLQPAPGDLAEVVRGRRTARSPVVQYSLAATASKKAIGSIGSLPTGLGCAPKVTITTLRAGLM